MKNSLCFLMLLFLGLQTFPQGKNLIVNKTGKLMIDGVQRNFKVHLPLGYEKLKDKKLPLVVVLHGRGGTPKSIALETNFSQKANEENFIVIYPEGIKRSWADVRGTSPASELGIDDIKFINELLLSMKTIYNIDTAAMFLVGISNGGFMAQTYLTKNPGVFKAVVSVIASLPVQLDITVNNFGQTGFAYFLGTDDPLMPYGGGAAYNNQINVVSAFKSAEKWAALNNCELSPVVYEFPDIAKDGTTVTKYSYNNNLHKTMVELFVVNNGGHQYPGGVRVANFGKKTDDINATTEIWNFFKTFIN